MIHIVGQSESDMNLGQPRHPVPQHHVAWWCVSRAVEITSETGKSDQQVTDSVAT